MTASRAKIRYYANPDSWVIAWNDIPVKTGYGALTMFEISEYFETIEQDIRDNKINEIINP